MVKVNWTVFATTVSAVVVMFFVWKTEAAAARSKRDVSSDWYRNSWSTSSRNWNVDNRIPMNADSDRRISRVDDTDFGEDEARKRNNFKKYKRYMLPLLLAYKLKFFTLIPVLIGGLVLLTGTTGLAGFFFALFAATMGLKGGGDH